MDQFRCRLLADSDQRVEDRDIAYRAMHLAAELLAPWCPTIVLDATYTAHVCRAELWYIVQHARGVLSVIECCVSPTTAETRWRARGMHPARDLTPQRVRTLATSYPYSNRPPIVSSGGDVALASLVRELRATCLNDTEGAAWSANGLERESSGRATRKSLLDEPRLAPACGDASRWRSLQSRT